MSDITIRLPVETIVSSVQAILSLAPNSLGGNPLCAIIANAIKESAPQITKTVQRVTSEFVASEEFAKRIRQVYRDALIGEASRMGVNAARAAMNAKEATK